MKLLLDQNLSRHLVSQLQDLYPGSTHVALVGLAAATDAAIWEYAGAHGLTVVSKDSDFREFAFRQGPPPRAIHLEVGNASTREVLALLRANHADLLMFDQGDARLLVISGAGP